MRLPAADSDLSLEHDPAIKGFAVDTQVPQFDGVHHLKLPVSDLDRSREWYQSRLGYAVAMEFREDGKVMVLALNHPDGGPRLALRLDPGKAAASSGFDYFSIGVPTKAAIDQLSARLTQLGTPMLASRSPLSGGFCPVSRTRTDTRSASTPRSPTKKRPTGRSMLWRMPGRRPRTKTRNRCLSDHSR